MNDDGHDNLETLHWAKRELRQVYATTHDFGIIAEFIESLPTTERTMLWDGLFWDALRDREWDFAESCLREGYSLVPPANELTGFSALHDAMSLFGERLDVIQWLLQHGANIEQRDSSNSTPLMAAVGHGFKEITKLLLRNGARVNASMNIDDDSSPLMVAAIAGDESMVKLLIDNGADICQKNRWGLDATQIAERNGHHDLARLMRRS